MVKAISHNELTERYFYNPETGCFSRINKGGKIGKAVGYYGKKYGTINIKGKSYLIHRLAWFYVHGEWPENDIDHINGNEKDNRIANLRCATRQQNSWNRKLAANNTTGYKGVSQCRRTGLYVAQIKQNGKVTVIGRFYSAEEASREYESHAMKLRGEYHMQTVDFDNESRGLIDLPIPKAERRVCKVARRQRRSQMLVRYCADAIMFG
ncbi:HNH endonuclease [Klebsiella pasteurii]|uniref:HNH endonuclease n=1 Tax=Klebsiella pasteurii TaxID=2587529 RepID=UPI0035D0EB29